MDMITTHFRKQLLCYLSMLYVFRPVMSLFSGLNMTVLHHQGRFMCILTPAKHRGCGKSLYYQSNFKRTPHISISSPWETVCGAQVIFFYVLYIHKDLLWILLWQRTIPLYFSNCCSGWLWTLLFNILSLLISRNRHFESSC